MAEKLFTDPKNKIITAYDIFGKKHKRNLSNFKFRASVYGVLVENNKILLKRHPWIKQFELPGGGVELDETIHQALIREFKEETGLTISVERLLGVEDSFFTFEGQDAHGILIFYEVKKVSGGLATNHEDSAEAKFFKLDELSKNNTHKSCWNTVKKIKKYEI